MAFTHQMTSNGALLRTGAGQLQGECCCTTPADCGSTGCTSQGVSVQCPSMQLTVFDADYAGGDINWAGQTWTQSEVQAGATKTGCPTNYGRGLTTSTYGPATFSLWRESWIYNVAGRYLNVFRTWGQYLLEGSCLNYSAVAAVRVLNSQDLRQWFLNCAGTVTYSSSTYPNQLGILSGTTVTPGSLNNYRISAIPALASNTVTIGGVQYSWSQGSGW